MIEKYGDCGCNPKGTGHCMHQDFRPSTAGTIYVSRCCWCGHEDIVQISHPDHGPHADSKKLY